MTFFLLSLFFGFVLGLGLAWLLLWFDRGEHRLEPSEFFDYLPDRHTSRTRFWVYLLTGFIMAGVFSLNFFLLSADVSAVADQFAVADRTLLFWQIVSALLVASALYDLSFRLIPFFIVFSLLVVALAGPLFFPLSLPLSGALIGGLVVGGVVLLLYLFSRGRGIGEADIFLAAIIGLLFGALPGLIIFSVANFLGLLVVLPLIAFVGKKRMKHIPLVFFLVLAIFLERSFQYSSWVMSFMGIS